MKPIDKLLGVYLQPATITDAGWYDHALPLMEYIEKTLRLGPGKMADLLTRLAKKLPETTRTRDGFMLVILALLLAGPRRDNRALVDWALRNLPEIRGNIRLGRKRDILWIAIHYKYLGGMKTSYAYPPKIGDIELVPELGEIATAL